jgi:FAD:protein FMN transferase
VTVLEKVGAVTENERQHEEYRETPPADRKKRHLPQRSFALVVVVLLVAVYFLSGRGPGGQLFLYRQLLMDTTVELRFDGSDPREAEQLKDAVFGEMARLERLLSRTVEDSDVSLINSRAGLAPAAVNPETMALIETALAYGRLSEGAFDITVAPLLDRWGFRDRQYRLPSPAEIEQALRLVDYTLVEVDPARGTVFLPAAGMSLDLGGIAKGYIVDRGLAELKKVGVSHAFLNAGGDIGLIGSRPDGTPWRIGIKDPRGDDIIRILPLAGDIAVVTSGDYERFFEQDGVRYHHILDPATGYPTRSLASVTVVAPTAVVADALSTALFVLGPERGMALIESLPGVEAVLITTDLAVLVSSGLAGTIITP